MQPLRSLATVLIPLTLVPACVGHTYRISDKELTRLAYTDPAVRGQHVRVVQDWSTASEPVAAQPVESNTEIVIIEPFHPGPRHHVEPRPPPDRPDLVDHRSNPTAPTASRGNSGSSSGSGHGVGKADDAKAAAIAVLVIAATALVVVGATEGSRYDGWVDLHPMYPLHLYGRDGGSAIVPLAQLDPGMAAWTERAVIVPGEGPWRDAGRAPLDRTGWTYGMLFGAASSVSADGTLDTGPSSHIQLGYFPSHQLGVQADVVLGWRDNVMHETLFDSRYGLELDFYPLDAGPLHAGLFGGAGIAKRFEDRFAGATVGSSDTALFGGAQLQLSITTRLALTGRLGISRAYEEEPKELSVGLSVY